MTEPSVVYDVKAALDEAGIEVISADSPMVAENLVPVTDSGDAKAILRILEALEDNDDAASATTLALGESAQAIICQDDDDFYMMTTLKKRFFI